MYPKIVNLTQVVCSVAIKMLNFYFKMKLKDDTNRHTERVIGEFLKTIQTITYHEEIYNGRKKERRDAQKPLSEGSFELYSLTYEGVLRI